MSIRYCCLLTFVLGALLCASCTRKINVAPVERPFKEAVPLIPIPEPPAPPPVYLPVLAYHRVSPVATGDMVVTPEAFRRQMAYLAAHGYQPITLDQWAAAITGNAPLPPKPVAITFDDGWRDQYMYALPILEQYGYPATFYAYTTVIGSPAAMTWDQLRELVRRGHTIGCHSATHSDLTKPLRTETGRQYAQRLVRETSEVRRAMEAQVRAPVRHFCYPYGYYNTNVMAHLAAAGFLTAATVNPAVNGRGTPLYSLGRLIVAPWTTADGLAAHLQSRPLPLRRVTPADGVVRVEPTSCFSAHVPMQPDQPLCNVRVKWNWKWTDCTWDRATDTVTCYFGTQLTPGLYTAQIHGWDADSNHYVYAWLFQQGRIVPARPSAALASSPPVPADTQTADTPQLVLLTPMGARHE